METLREEIGFKEAHFLHPTKIVSWKGLARGEKKFRKNVQLEKSKKHKGQRRK